MSRKLYWKVQGITDDECSLSDEENLELMDLFRIARNGKATGEEKDKFLALLARQQEMNRRARRKGVEPCT